MLTREVKQVKIGPESVFVEFRFGNVRGELKDELAHRARERCVDIIPYFNIDAVSVRIKAKDVCEAKTLIKSVSCIIAELHDELASKVDSDKRRLDAWLFKSAYRDRGSWKPHKGTES